MNFWSLPFSCSVARSQKTGDKNRTELDWKWDGKGLVWLGSRAKKRGGGGEEEDTTQLTRVKTPSLAINIYSQIEADENLGTGLASFLFSGRKSVFLSRHFSCHPILYFCQKGRGETRVGRCLSSLDPSQSTPASGHPLILPV